ncbi:hypothetical protein GGR21_000604 [Dysgonomonas hofstadii]|uniref:Uncharacterized protein n=1 Tax=Dysgonomonas hofstadii TaxID=637886 RepID=A0A840CFE3_9BACT|nr:hypothetical protein [Dysgonomonas hofstadii]
MERAKSVRFASPSLRRLLIVRFCYLSCWSEPKYLHLDPSFLRMTGKNKKLKYLSTLSTFIWLSIDMKY